MTINIYDVVEFTQDFKDKEIFVPKETTGTVVEVYSDGSYLIDCFDDEDNHIGIVLSDKSVLKKVWDSATESYLLR